MVSRRSSFSTAFLYTRRHICQAYDFLNCPKLTQHISLFHQGSHAVSTLSWYSIWPRSGSHGTYVARQMKLFSTQEAKLVYSQQRIKQHQSSKRSMHCHEAVLSQDKGVGIGIARPRHLIAARGRPLTSAQAVQGALDAEYGPGDDKGSALQLVCTAMHGQDKNPSRGQGSLHKQALLES